MFRCWNCGADNPEGEDHCSICGFHLARVKSLLDDQRTLEAILRLYQEMIRGLRGKIGILEEDCQRRLPGWETWCEQCGAPIVKSAEYCWQCGDHTYPARCPNRMCLTPNPADHAFCDWCGWGLMPEGSGQRYA